MKQDSSKRTNLITFRGVEKSISAHARDMDFLPSTVIRRLQAGMSIEDALTIPSQKTSALRPSQKPAVSEIICNRCHAPKAPHEFYPEHKICKTCYITKVKNHQSSIDPLTIRSWKIKYNKTHPEQMAQNTARYRKANPDAVQTCVVQRRARIAGAAINDFTNAQWRLMQELYDHCCAYCGTRAKGHLVREHIIPIVDHGDNTWDNIVPACHPCNRHKYTGPPPRLDFLRFPKPLERAS